MILNSSQSYVYVHISKYAYFQHLSFPWTDNKWLANSDLILCFKKMKFSKQKPPETLSWSEVIGISNKAKVWKCHLPFPYFFI